MKIKNVNDPICWFIQDRLKSVITQPDAPELLHPVFVPLGLVGHYNILFGSFSVSLSLSVILTVAMVPFSDCENHWRASVRCVCSQSCNDQWCCFTTQQTSDWRGKGAVDIIRAQLDFTLVSVFIHICESVSCCSNKILFFSFLVRNLVCLFLRTHLSSWMGGSLRPMIQMANL